MFEPFKINRGNVTDSVVDYLKGLIHEGKLTSGQRMHPEREMAHLMSLSRNTIREAYKILAAQGLLIIKHGHGVFVTDADTQMQQITSSFFIRKDKIEELFSIRKVLETQAVKWVIENFQDSYMKQLTEICSEAESTLKKENYDKLALLDQKFHMALTRMSGNSILVTIMIHLIDFLSEARTKSIRIPGRAEQSLREHKLIMDSIEMKDIKLAKKYMLDHLNSVERSILNKNDIHP
jgi:GntR family transcriptional repressor for pyruvate dehydrogenase complex